MQKDSPNTDESMPIFSRSDVLLPETTIFKEDRNN